MLMHSYPAHMEMQAGKTFATSRIDHKHELHIVVVRHSCILECLSHTIVSEVASEKKTVGEREFRNFPHASRHALRIVVVRRSNILECF